VTEQGIILKTARRLRVEAELIEPYCRSIAQEKRRQSERFYGFYQGREDWREAYYEDRK
jgi:hypothetical protein